jgi:hypothetical protein
VNPGATETVADGVDQDCSGGDSCYVDADSDSYRSMTTTSTVVSSDLDCADSGEGAATEPATDCDDALSTVHPGAADPTDGGLVDNDCDGLYDEDDIVAGSVFLTEFFVSSTQGSEWFEIYNDSGFDLALDGWTFTVCYEPDNTEADGYLCSADPDGDADSDTFTISDLQILDGGYAVLCNDATSFTLAACDYDYTPGSIASGLDPGDGGAWLELEGTTIDEISWWDATGSADDWPTDTAASVQFSSDQFAATPDLTNDGWTTATPATDLWCLTTATTDWASTGTFYGSPGAANEDCTP